MAKWKPGEPLEITTERFTLRSLTRDDVSETLLGWLTDPELMEFLGGPWKTETVEQLADGIEKIYDDKAQYMLGVFHEGKHIGCYWIEAYLNNRSAVTHHMLGDKTYWGKGVPLECRTALLDWLFRRGFERVEGRPYTTCIRAIRGYMKQGWRLEGIARRASRDRNGKRHDNMLFALLPEDWAMIRRQQLRAMQAGEAAQAQAGEAAQAQAGEAAQANEPAKAKAKQK